MSVQVTFNRPFLGHEEERALVRALREAAVGGYGCITRSLQRRLAEWLGVKQVLLTTSCTTALELAMMLLNLRPGDEVIMPSFGFVTAANAVIRAGGRPVFADIDVDTYNLDPKDAEKTLSPRTRAIMPVHYGGQACDMGRLQELADSHGLVIVEDAAQAVGSRWGGRLLGTVGRMGAFSFHVTKNLTCGEGGAFVIDDEALAHRAEILWDKGTNRSAFIRGEAEKYVWHDVGGNFALSDLLAALLEVQFQRLQDIIAARRQHWERYAKELEPLAATGKIRLHHVANPSEFNYHLFALRTIALPQADLIKELMERGVEAAFHFVPLHSSPFGRKLHPSTRALPNTHEVAASLVRLPLYPDLTLEEHCRVVEAIYEVFNGARAA
jgi:dTDP-4-amino-4,6-dideoxygalactose transaminase